jgi:L-threonylcarbamoyladenylate synthase
MHDNSIIKLPTIILSANKDGDIILAAEIIKRGGVVALPTETVYGLAAKGLCPNSIKKIYQAKNRPQKNPVILHVSSLEQTYKLVNFSNLALKRFEKLSSLWPAALTIIAKKSNIVPNEVSFGLDTVALRMPNHETTLKIISLVNEPLAMPSANLSTRPSPTLASHVLSTLNNRIDGILDGGKCSLGLESSVVSIFEDQVYLLRLGTFSQQQIEDVLEEKIVVSLSNKHKPLSPGQSFLHYSPKVAEIKFISFSEVKAYWQSDCSILLTKSQYDSAEYLGARPKDSITLNMPDEALEYAKKFYDALYFFENNPDKPLILVEPSQKGGVWLAIKERMTKAANKNT